MGENNKAIIADWSNLWFKNSISKNDDQNKPMNLSSKFVDFSKYQKQMSDIDLAVEVHT